METLRELIEMAVADYGFRLAVMWGPDDVIAMSSLTDEEASVLKRDLLPELKALPDPVEPADRSGVNERLMELAEGRLGSG
ncbi:MAG: hypothetical protein J4G14_05740 [Dehalococcoidia bacterium]|nr:hypothetical protein [Dehalococcoidia bacterium]